MPPHSVLHRINHSQASPSPRFECRPPPAGPRTSSSTPNRARAPRRRGTVARTACTCPTARTSQTAPSSPNCSPRPRHTKSSPAPPGTTRAHSPTSRGTHSRARGPPLSSSGRPPCRCSKSGPSCPPHISLPRPRRTPCTFCRRYIVPRPHHALSPDKRACVLSSAAFGIPGHNSGACRPRIENPWLAKGAADGRMRVRIIFL